LGQSRQATLSGSILTIALDIREQGVMDSYVRSIGHISTAVIVYSHHKAANKMYNRKWKGLIA